MVRKSEFPVPPGFTWHHVRDTYVHSDGRTWDSNTNTFYNVAGETIPQTAPPVPQAGMQSSERVDSTSDRRTDNNVMRHEYRILSDAEKAQMTAIKDAGVAFHALCDSLGTSRELSLAKTNIEQAVMWAVKHLTK